MSNRSLSLRDAAARTPPATGKTQEWVTRMADAMRDAITPDDIREIMQKQVEKAKQGDAKAAQTVLDFIGRAQPRVSQVVVGVRGQAHGTGNGNGHKPALKVVESAAADDTGDEPDAAPGQIAAADRTATKDLAEALGTVGPMTAPDLAKRSSYPLATVSRLLIVAGPGTELGYFEHLAGSRWRLTAAGRQDLLPQRADDSD